MKTCEEIAENVFRKRDEYKIKKRKISISVIAVAVILATLTCALIISADKKQKAPNLTFGKPEASIQVTSAITESTGDHKKENVDSNVVTDNGTNITFPENDVNNDDEGITEIGGGGDNFDSYYIEGFRSVCFGVMNSDGKPVNFEATFITEREDEITKLLMKYDDLIVMNDCSYRNILWYLVRDLGLSREDIVEYESMMDESIPEKLTDEQIDYLFIEDEYEARNAMRAPWTLFDGKTVYRITDIEKMTKQEFRSHSFKADDIERLINYLEENPDWYEDYINVLKDYK